MNYWYALSSLGKVDITFPIAGILAMWILVCHERKMALKWCVLFGASMVLVMASKIVFIGWGVGIQSLDFTGISGHAARASAVYPVLFYFVFQRAPRYVISWAVFLGITLGLFISISRVMINVHSGSEIFVGWLLGMMVCGSFFYSIQSNSLSISRWWLFFSSLLCILISPSFKPVPTEHWVTKIALFLSGHQKPYQREMWEKSEHERHFW